jgi:hypothetical protein
MKIKRFVISIIAVAFLAACAMPPPEMPGTTQPTQLAEQPTATHTPAPTSTPEPHGHITANRHAHTQPYTNRNGRFPHHS